MSFSARDLALLLPDNVGEAQHVKTSAEMKEETPYEAPKPKIDASKKTRRYFPGKTPDWIPEEEEEVTFTVDPPATSTAATSEAPVDRRLARLQQKSSRGTEKGGEQRRRRYEAEVVIEKEEENREASSRYESIPALDLDEGSILEGDSALLQRLERRAEEEAEEEDVSARRARIKAKLLAAAREEEEEKAEAGEGEEESEESEYETETDSEEESEDETDRVMLKPVFIPRARRETLREQEEQEEKVAAVREKKGLLKEESRKHQTRVLVAESLRRQEDKQALDALAATDVDSDSGMPDDNDLTDDDDDEYASWKVRELNRIRSEAERREALVEERVDLARRRALTAEERLAEDTKMGKFRDKEKKKWKYLQKYYHKGVFYMDDKSTGKQGTCVESSASGSSATPAGDYYSPRGASEDKTVEEAAAARKAAEKKVDARLRDYSGATLEDTYNREALPAVLQVKKFGMRGRTKYTHLVDQDTTSFGPAAMGKDRGIQEKFLGKRSGVGDIDNAGRRRKK